MLAGRVMLSLLEASCELEVANQVQAPEEAAVAGLCQAQQLLCKSLSHVKAVKGLQGNGLPHQLLQQLLRDWAWRLRMQI